MTREWAIVVHEAGHAVVAWYFGMTPTSMTFVGDDGNPCTTHNRESFLKGLPGKGLIRDLLASIITAVELAAGGCAELAIGIDHQNCGWSSDATQLQPHLTAISKICGYSYEYCWEVVSAMAKEVLAEADLWLAVEELAEDFVRTRTLGAPELSAFFSVRDGAACSDRVQVLLGFVDTPAARATAKAHGVDR